MVISTVYNIDFQCMYSFRGFHCLNLVNFTRKQHPNFYVYQKLVQILTFMYSFIGPRLLDVGNLRSEIFTKFICL